MSDMGVQQFKKIYEGDRKKRLKIKNEKRSKNKLDLSAMVDKIKGKVDAFKSNNDFEDKESDAPSETKSKGSSHYGRVRRNKKISKIQMHQNSSSPTEGKSILGIQNNKKYANDVNKFVFPGSAKIDLSPDNIDEFLSKNWIELMEV